MGFTLHLIGVHRMSDPFTGPALSRASGFLVALERLLGMGALYPPGHARCREAASRACAALDGLGDRTELVRVRMTATSLQVGAEVVELTLPGAARVHEILFGLAISRVELPVGISAGDLLDFAARLAELRVAQETSRSSGGPTLDGFPDAVRVRQRVFGGRLLTPEGRVDPSVAQLVLDRMARDLDGQAIDPETWAACRSLVHQMIRSTVERLDLAGAPSDGGARRALEEVLELGVHALESAIEDLVRSGQGEADLPTLSRRTEQALALSDDERSMEIMLDVLRQATAGPHHRSAPGHTAPADAGDPAAVVPASCTLSLQALEKVVAEATDRARCPDLEPPLDGCEPLSVVIQLLLDPTGPQAVVTATEALPRVVSAAGPEAAAELLATVLREVISDRPENEADRLITVLLRALRGEDPAAAMSLLVSLDADLDPLRLWPHVVNELLLGEVALTTSRLEGLVARVGGLPVRARASGLVRLDRLDAVRQGRIGSVAFDPPRHGLAAVYAHLLDGPCREATVARLYDGLRTSSGAWPGSELLASLPGCTLAGRERLARAAATVNEPAALRQAVAQVVVEEIARLPEAARGAAGIATTVEALGVAAPVSSRPLLLRIRHERRFLIVPRWPRPCRDAAARALARTAEDLG
jgi:hypothetical protein